MLHIEFTGLLLQFQIIDLNWSGQPELLLPMPKK